MPFNTPITKTEKYLYGRGVCYFAPFQDDGTVGGERDLGNCPGLTVTVTSEKSEHFSSRSGMRLKDREITVSVAFNSSVLIEDFSAENMALMFAGRTQTVTQTAGAVTNEDIPNLQGGREYQLGVSSINPTGVRGVTSVGVAIKENELATARANSTAYALGDMFSSGGGAYIVSTAGTSAGSAPTYDTASIGATTTDGTAVVKYMGPTATFTVTTHYGLSAEAARVQVAADKNLGLAADLFYSIKGTRPNLRVDYTKNANTRTQIVSTGEGAITGQFRFISDNAGDSENKDLFISSCNLSPDGEIAFINESEAAQATFALGVNLRDSSTPQIIVDGRPV